MIRRLLLSLLLFMIASTGPAWSTTIVVSPGGTEDRLPALRGLAEIFLREYPGRSGDETTTRPGGKTAGDSGGESGWQQSLAKLASEIAITDVPDLLRALQQGRQEEFENLSGQFKTLQGKSGGVDGGDALAMRNNGERQSGLIAIDIALLAALQLRVEQALTTTTDPTTRSLLTTYLQKVTTAQGELKRYQNDVSKMLRVEFTPPAPERTEKIAEMIAEMIGEVGEKSTHLNQEISHAADRRGEDWYSDAISRLLDMLRDLDELKAHLHELLGGSLTRTERAMLETLLRQIAEMQEAIARDLKTTASSAQLAAEMQRQETLAREKPLGSYSHLSWGVWGSEAMPGKPIYQNSHWIAGSLTPAAAIPVTGTASYNGQVVGQLNEAGALTTVTGTSSLTVLFDNRGLSGSFDNMKRANGTAWTSATVNATWGAGTNQISGTVNAANGMSGAVNASFFGPAANHVGGSWSLSGGGNQASGVFVGDKQ